MNNKNLIAVFFGMACLALLVGIVTTSEPLNDINGKTNTPNPQQINQTMPNTTFQTPTDNTLPTEMDANKVQDSVNNMQPPNNLMQENTPTKTPNE